MSDDLMKTISFIAGLYWSTNLVFVVLANTGYPDLNPFDFTEAVGYFVAGLYMFSCADNA